jgi:hypothetical protein
MGIYSQEAGYEREILELHQEHARERSKLELRLERLADELWRVKREGEKGAGKVASREYAERIHEALDTLIDVVKKQNRVIEEMALAIDFDSESFKDLRDMIKQVEA